MVKKGQLLEDATDFTDRIKGKFVKKELTLGLSSAKPIIGKKRPFSIMEGPSQEKKPKVFIPNTPAKSNCKHCDKPGHTADECWRKVGACLRCGSRKQRIPECLLLKEHERRTNANLAHQEQRRTAGEWSFFLNRALLRPVHNLVLDLHKGEAEENEYTHEDGEDQE
ncbi:hypothetical protein Taro_002006 [Colocasia esculenta]|uniref:CCHC-type domain-containing protein n=1 Tax=Colocasia esculenta TaxID=4460 RepID=A0A843TF72_COLES|nr:hypothetical protein [Colocasia esculenta]